MYSPQNLDLRMSIMHIWYQSNALPSYVQLSRASNGFMYYAKGEGQEFDFGDRIYRAQRGDLLFLPYGARYTNRKLSEDTEYYEIDFMLFDVNNTAFALFDEPFVVPKHEAGEYFNLIKEVYDIFTNLDPSRNYLCFGNICKMIDMFRANRNAGSCGLHGINSILQSVNWLRDHFDQDISLQELAERSSMSVSNLEKIFKKSYGLSPIAYRNQLRINHAKSLLLNGYSVGETADMVGFSNYHYFCKQFKIKTGLSPGKFIKINSGM